MSAATPDAVELRCDLCIIGAGYAGVNAYNAAVKYLKPGAKVIVVDPRASWGGQWIDQYDFVRLHQPYPIFTAGERGWCTTKPSDHLATKTEIIAHFEDIVKLATVESSVDLVELFGFRYTGHSSNGSVVDVEAECCTSAHDGIMAPVPQKCRIRANRLIKALGLNIQIKEPLPISSSEVYSLDPGDVLAPHWKAAMRFSDKPIWVVGSGKTGLDCINHLHESGEDFSSRIGCISGRGMWYIVRDVAFPTGFIESNFTSTTAIEWFFAMLEMHDGDNESEIYKEMGRRGFFHSAVPEPQSFALGISSRAEVASAKLALGDRIVKAHLLDIIDGDEGNAVMRLRALDGTVFDQPIAKGSFIINATDHFKEDNINTFDPIVSDDGLVLSPQTALAFTGAGADLLTHAWYLGLIEKFWRDLLRGEQDTVNKHKGGITGIYQLAMNTSVVMGNLPPSIQLTRKSQGTGVIPLHRRLFTMLKLGLSGRGAAMLNKSKLMSPLRYTDEVSTVGVRVHHGFAGNLDKEAAAAFSPHSRL